MSMKEKQDAAIVAAFNSETRVGMQVILINDMGEREETYTESEAYIDAAGQKMIQVAGKRGGYLLERIIPAEPYEDDE